MITPEERLPRLFYLADVPVESTYHGSALIYRLLQNYPKDRLRIIEGGAPSLPEQRLSGVVYAHQPVASQRLLHTRFQRWYATWVLLAAAAASRRMGRALGSFAPEAVLTVAHGFSWLTAAAFARKNRLPLFLIVHDDCPSISPVVERFQPRLRREFTRIYREAAARLCVSPFMEEEYRGRYKVNGNVLYPSRAADFPVFSGLAKQLTRERGGLVIAFAGNVGSRAYARLIGILAEALGRHNGTLLLYGPYSAADLQRWDLTRENIRFEGMLASNELIERLRSDADVLFVPMSFDKDEEEGSMRFGFPSKLADYTAVGLPLLIFGPPYCSAVRWAEEHRPVAEVVVEETPSALGNALERLRSPQHRETLAKRALEVGEQLFSHAKAQEVLYSALESGQNEIAELSQVERGG